ncbi:MAG TPA: FecR family protein [bacterium]
MKTLLVRSAWLFLMVALAASVAFGQDDEIVASLQNMLGRVQVVQKANGETVQGRVGLLLRAGDTIVTADDSRATIKFRDGSEIRLFQNTRFVLQGAKESVGQDRSFKYDLLLRAGSLWGNFVKQRQAASISTPTATIGIKGTTLRITEQGNTARVALTEGVIDVSNERKTIELEPGKRLTDFSRVDDLATKVQPIPYKVEMRSEKRKLAFGSNQPEEVFITLQLTNVTTGREVPRAATIYFRSNYDKITYPPMAKLDQRGFARVPLTFQPPEAADAQLAGNVYVWAVVDSADADDTGEGRILFNIPVKQGEERIKVDADKGAGKRAN